MLNNINTIGVILRERSKSKNLSGCGYKLSRRFFDSAQNNVLLVNLYIIKRLLISLIHKNFLLDNDLYYDYNTDNTGNTESTVNADNTRKGRWGCPNTFPASGMYF